MKDFKWRNSHPSHVFFLWETSKNWIYGIQMAKSWFIELGCPDVWSKSQTAQSFTKQQPKYLDFTGRPASLIWAVPGQMTGICPSLLLEDSLLQLWPGTFVAMPLIPRCCLGAQHSLWSIAVDVLHVATPLRRPKELENTDTALLWQPASGSWAHFISKSGLPICIVLS